MKARILDLQVSTVSQGAKNFYQTGKSPSDEALVELFFLVSNKCHSLVTVRETVQRHRNKVMKRIKRHFSYDKLPPIIKQYLPTKADFDNIDTRAHPVGLEDAVTKLETEEKAKEQKLRREWQKNVDEYPDQAALYRETIVTPKKTLALYELKVLNCYISARRVSSDQLALMQQVEHQSRRNDPAINLLVQNIIFEYLQPWTKFPPHLGTDIDKLDTYLNPSSKKSTKNKRPVSSKPAATPGKGNQPPDAKPPDATQQGNQSDAVGENEMADDGAVPVFLGNRGLKNNSGNQCFLNAFVQFLLKIEEFVVLAKKAHQYRANATKGYKLLHIFNRIIAGLKNKNTAFSMKELIIGDTPANVLLANLLGANPANQDDTHSLIQELFNNLQMVDDYLVNDIQAFIRLFEIQTNYYKACIDDLGKEIKDIHLVNGIPQQYQSEYGINLKVDEDTVGTDITSLIEKYTQKESIEAYFESCDNRTDGTKAQIRNLKIEKNLLEREPGYQANSRWNAINELLRELEVINTMYKRIQISSTSKYIILSVPIYISMTKRSKRLVKDFNEIDLNGQIYDAIFVCVKTGSIAIGHWFGFYKPSNDFIRVDDQWVGKQDFKNAIAEIAEFGQTFIYKRRDA